MKKAKLVCLILPLIGSLLMCAGCASVSKQGTQSTEDLLMAAGFTVKIPKTPEGEAKFNSLKPLTMAKGINLGEVVYIFPDPYKCKCAYVGTEQQYMQYRRLASQRGFAEEDIAASDMGGGPDVGEWGW